MTQSIELTIDTRLNRLADLAKALGHPARLRILQILAEAPGCICGDIVERLPLAQATVSQHLKELKQVGLIQGEISGPRTCYCLDSQTTAQARAAFKDLFSGIECCPDQGGPHEINPQGD